MMSELHKLQVKWREGYTYMSALRLGVSDPAADTDERPRIGDGPFPAVRTTFPHNNAPAVQIQYPDETWSRPMTPEMFKECEVAE